ncbi:MAG: DUF4190 domain-containing protein [Verrucomicrobiales bacterium]|jgi:hypothetical protein|nr:DUF4190 domain-containing protein [Verrucomicrobiales bacterium]
MTDAVAPLPSPLPVTKKSGLAVTSFVLGIISLVGCGLLTGIPAAICGHVAGHKIKQSGGALTGGSLAVAGWIMGYVSFFITIVLVGLAIPAINGAIDAAHVTASLAKARQIGNACVAYAADHDGQYPASLDELRRDQQLDAMTLRSMFDSQPGAVGFALVSGDNCVLIYDLYATRQTRHPKRAVAVVDKNGVTSKIMPDDEFQALLQDTKKLQP